MTIAIYDANGVEVTDEEREYAVHVSVCGGHDSKHNTINLTKRCLADGIPGDLVECGAHSGGEGAMMGYVLKRNGVTNRKVHLFDSWQGQPQASIHDDASYREQLGVNTNPLIGIQSGVFPCSLEHCQDNLRQWGAPLEQFIFHQGWLQEVLPGLAAHFPSIALLRIDVDLHDSTVPIFNHLYDRVSPGGYIISDDWGETEGYDACRKATFDFFDGRGLPRPNVTRLPQTRGTVWWRKPE